MAKKQTPRRPSPPPPPAVPDDPRLDAMAYGPDGKPGRRAERNIRKPPLAEPKAPGPSKQARLWDGRVQRAGKIYDAWSLLYETKHLDDYYAGRHWRGHDEEAAKKKYSINLVFATVETQIPSLLFTRPKVEVESRPNHEQTATSQASARATLIQQTLQTFIDDPKLRFTYETTLALRDAYPRFAIVEVGYTGDWIDNPNLGKPVLKEDDSVMMEGEGAEATPVLDDRPRVLKPLSKEAPYVKRIPAWTYRVGSTSHNNLTSNDWAGYYEYHALADVRRNPRYANTENLVAGDSLIGSEEEPDRIGEEGDTKKRVGMIKLWKIWDLRTKTHIVHAEGHTQILLTETFTVLPHAVLKFYELQDEFYPLPPIYNWLSPQDEINEIRESQRTHRRRFVRRYMSENGIADTELEKLESDVDGVSIKVPKISPPPIAPIVDAPLDTQNWQILAASRDDFNQISGVSGESRNSPSAPTATQANIINTHSQLRESAARTKVAEWLGEIVRLMLVVVRERVKMPMMVKRTVDPFAALQDPEQLTQNANLWHEISVESIEDLDVDIKIDVSSLSPVAEEATRNQWNGLLTLFSNPNVMAWLMMPNPKAPDEPSPLLRKTLMNNGIKSDQEIRELWRVGQAMRAQAQQAAASMAQQAKAPEPIKMSLALKGEDLKDPILGPLFMQLVMRETGVQMNLSAMATPQTPLNQAGDGGGMGAPPVMAGAATGIPDKGPALLQ